MISYWELGLNRAWLLPAVAERLLETCMLVGLDEGSRAWVNPVKATRVGMVRFKKNDHKANRMSL